MIGFDLRSILYSDGLKRPLNPYHVVPSSPWPFISAIGLFGVFIGLSSLFADHSCFLLLLGVGTSCWGFGFWMRDIVRESTYMGLYTLKVRIQLKLGFFLFLVSEIMLFVSCFWAFFHSALSPTVSVGCLWPPQGILVPNPLEAAVGTGILLASGVSVIWAHHSVKFSRGRLLQALSITIVQGIAFSLLQIYEYYYLSFTFADGIYGCTFYLLTGLHGFHVIAGTLGLVVCWGRAWCHHFSPSYHLGLDAAVWYWHFVDVVWVFVYLSVYLWGSPYTVWDFL